MPQYLILFKQSTNLEVLPEKLLLAVTCFLVQAGRLIQMRNLKRRKTSSAEPKRLLPEGVVLSPFGPIFPSLSAGSKARDSFGALSQLDRLLRRIERNHYRALAARSYWIRGMVQFARGEPTLSLRDFQKALVCLSGTQAAEDEGAIHYLIAGNLSYLGDFREAWRHLYQALAATPGAIQERRLFSAFDEAGTALEKEGEVRAALYFRDAVVALARLSDRRDPTRLGHAYLRRAESRWKARREDDALADLRQARALAGRIDSPSLRDAALAKVDVAEAEMLVATSPEQALNLFKAALAYYLRLGSYFDLPRIYLGRYQALRGMGRLHDAVLELDHGIREYEQVRERVADEGNRATYFDQARGLFEMMMRLQEEMGRPEIALWYAERERSRDLLDLQATASRGEQLIGSRPLEPQMLANRMPAGVSLVVYALLSDHLLAWVVRRGTIIPFSLNLTRSEIASSISAIRSGLESGVRQDRLQAGLEDLYDQIIRPLAPFLESTVVFVPDGPLYGVPFAALRDRVNRRYLIESLTISLSPSASFYVEGLRVGKSLLNANSSVLAVGASEFDRAAFERLTRLPHAELEAKAVASLYSHSTLLLGSGATTERFVAELGKHNIIHFAGHTVSVAQSPSSSLMVFAPLNAETSGVLRGADLYRLEMERTTVVVLASCSTGFNSSASPEVALGLVRPFLARGVRAVVASLWNVGDIRATDLAISFHRELKRHRTPALALRAAQLDLMRSKAPLHSSPAAWSMLEVFGVDAS